MMRRFSACAIGLVALFCLVSCQEKGPERHRLSGEAKFNGQPIVFGDVVFTPSGANAGAQGFANIRDGKYDTAADGGKGFAGGPTTVYVTGFDKQGGKLLCEYKYEAELPKGEGTHNIDVPAKGAAGAGKPQGGPEI